MRMRTRFLTMLLAVAMLFAGAVSPAHAVMGIPDKVPGASLLVPYFEADIDPSLPRDTLLAVINHQTAGSRILHIQVWDRDGNRAFSLNATLPALSTYSRSMRDLINIFAGSAGKAKLTVGSLYQGFVTLNSVTAVTFADPRVVGYPFENSNAFTGNIYYTRLSQGSAKGLNMVSLEAGTAANGLQTGFFTGGDNREEIDLDSRQCVDKLARGVVCSNDSNEEISRLFFRTFGSGAPLSGRSDLIVFTWVPSLVGGPSVYCAAHPANCESSYQYRRRDEAGATVVSQTRTLTHVVNVIPVDSPFVSGHAVLFDIPSPLSNMQFFHFSINQANPTGNPALTFDAVFEGEFLP